MSIPRLAHFAAIASAALVAAPQAHAVALSFTGSLSMTMRIASETLEIPIPGSGVADVSSGSGVHLTAAALPGNTFVTQGFVLPVTDPEVFPIRGIQFTAANRSGSFAEGGRLHGVMPLVGIMKVCLFGPCSEAVANMRLPLSVVGQGGAAFVQAAVNLTVVGAPWTTGTAPVGASSVRGSARGPAGLPSSTAQVGGDLNLVTPIFISVSNVGPAVSIFPSFARTLLSFGDHPDCDDGTDNDGDGLGELPNDPG